MTTMQYYRDLLKQSERIEVFREAIAAVVLPGDSLIEIGSGLGTFAFFAADAGAANVWAVDGDPIIHVARVSIPVSSSSVERRTPVHSEQETRPCSA